nr:zinc ribbon domain-containing protein [Microbacterium testaceum]
MVYSQSTGNGGTYEYFSCSAKLKGQCDMHGIRAEELEDAVATQVAVEGVPPTALDWINAGISAAMDDLQAIDRQAKDALARQLAKLTQQEARLVDALADGDLPVLQLREKLQQLMLQKEAVEERLTLSDQSLRVGAERVRAAIDPLRDPGAIYRGLPESARRELLHALFSRVYAEITETDVSLHGERTAGNEAIQRLARHANEPEALGEASIKKIPGLSAESR